MRKKLIKKGQYAIPGGITNNTINWNDPNIYDQLMKSVGMDFSQPSTFSTGLFNSKISTSNNLPLPKPNMKNVLSSSGLGVPQSPDTSKIVSDLNSTLFDTGFQNRMAKGQSDHMKQMKSAQNKQKWGDFKSNMKEFGSSGIGKGADTISSLIPEQSNSTLTNGLNSAHKGISDTLMSIPDPTGTTKIIGGAMKLQGMMNQGLSAITGGASSIKDPSNMADSILSSNFLGMTPIGLANSFTGENIKGNSKALASMASSSGYGNSDSLDSTKIGGVTNTFNKLFGKDLVTKRKTDVLKINTENMKKANILQDNKKQISARTQAIGNTGMDNQKKLSGGLDYSVLTAKKGATLQDIRNYIKVRNIEKEVAQNPNLDDNLEKIEVSKFQNGGSLIPSGALHKNKHKIESINPELDGEITKKGIPVISYAEKGDVLEFENDGKTPKVLAEGGEVIQHAEIEVGEIILNISLTKKLIELMNKGTNDDMIHAGKLLAKEIMEDTTDNTGLIEKTIGNED